ncbi:hypothetical protein RMQ97_12095 [Maricaulis sp. D1M11]|uniref:hypothetical protein n=1 Tax=Maricaulis sp. D1M11 TaxID=3076117 RepID=UPI0039B6B102
MSNDYYSMSGSPEPVTQGLMLVSRFCRVVNALEVSSCDQYRTMQQQASQLMIASYHASRREFSDAELEAMGTVNEQLNTQLDIYEGELFADPGREYANFYQAFLNMPVEGDALVEMVTTDDPVMALQTAAVGLYGAPVYFAPTGSKFSLEGFAKVKKYLVKLLKLFAGASKNKVLLEMIAHVLDTLDDMYEQSQKVPNDDLKGGETAPCKIYIYLEEIDLADTSVGDDWFIDFTATINGAAIKIPRVTAKDLVAGRNVQNPPVLLASATSGLCGQNQAITIGMTPTEDDYYDDVGSPDTASKTIRCPGIELLTLSSQVTDKEEFGTPTTTIKAKLRVVLRCE